MARQSISSAMGNIIATHIYLLCVEELLPTCVYVSCHPHACRFIKKNKKKKKKKEQKHSSIHDVDRVFGHPRIDQ